VQDVLDLFAIAFDLARRGWKAAILSSLLAAWGWLVLLALGCAAGAALLHSGREVIGLLMVFATLVTSALTLLPAVSGSSLVVFVLTARGEAVTVGRALGILQARLKPLLFTHGVAGAWLACLSFAAGELAARPGAAVTVLIVLLLVLGEVVYALDLFLEQAVAVLGTPGPAVATRRRFVSALVVGTLLPQAIIGGARSTGAAREVLGAAIGDAALARLDLAITVLAVLVALWLHSLLAAAAHTLVSRAEPTP
jgi:hypothetical protein